MLIAVPARIATSGRRATAHTHRVAVETAWTSCSPASADRPGRHNLTTRPTGAMNHRTTRHRGRAITHADILEGNLIINDRDQPSGTVDRGLA